MFSGTATVAINRDDRVTLQRVAATPDTQRSGGRPPALGESPGGLTAKDCFAE